MTDRRQRPEGRDALGYMRMSERFETGFAAVMDRFEAFSDRMDHRLSRVDRDLASSEQDRQLIHRELAEMKRDLRNLGEGLALHSAEETRMAVEGAASGAATGVAKVAIEIAAQAKPKPDLRTLFTIIFLGLGGALTWGPKLLSFVTQALHWTGRGAD